MIKKLIKNVFFGVITLLLGAGSVVAEKYVVLKDKKLDLSHLTELQLEVTQNGVTEPPFKNKFWNNKAEGIYVDIVSGEPLFDSLHKYDSGTGWPSFYQTLAPENIKEINDRSWYGISQTEVRSSQGNSHLGHVFSDGPKPTGLRYCINSAALRFVPRSELSKQGYSKYENIFQDKLIK